MQSFFFAEHKICFFFFFESLHVQSAEYRNVGLTFFDDLRPPQASRQVLHVGKSFPGRRFADQRMQKTFYSDMHEARA